MNIDNKQQSLLTFRVGPVLCCAPSLPVRSIIKPPKFTRLPGSDSSQPGIFKHSSHIVKIFDLRQKFGIEKTKQTQPGNLIITLFEKDSFAFWVDQILDVFDFPSTGWSNLPAAIPRGVFSRTLLLNKKIHLYCEFENLAIIKDLGYLKYYIQQLTQQSSAPPAEKEKTTSTTNNEKPILEQSSPTMPAKKTHDTISTIRKPKPSNKKQTEAITPHSSQYKSEKQEAAKTSTQPSKRGIEKTIIKKTPIIKGRNQPSPIKSAIQKPPMQETSKKDILIAPTYETKKQPYKKNVVIEDKKTSTHTPSSYSHEETEASNINIIIFFIFILASLAAGIYYLFPEDYSSHSKNKKGNTISQTELNFSDEIIKKEITEITDFREKLKKSNLEQINTIDNLIDNPPPNTNVYKSKNETIKNIDYRADITQFDDEITITIHQPAKIIKSQQEASVPLVQKSNNEDNNGATVTTITIKPLEQGELSNTVPAKKIISEVIHIIVKGDTLWGIAKKYVNDPFLYPELARLSNIKNPHRIYPGNRVRIRFIKN